MGKKIALIGLCLMTAIAVLPFGSAMWTDKLTISGSLSIAKPPVIPTPLPETAPNMVTPVGSAAMGITPAPVTDGQPSITPIIVVSSLAAPSTPVIPPNPAPADLVSTVPVIQAPSAPTPEPEASTPAPSEVQPPTAPAVNPPAPQLGDPVTTPTTGVSEPVAPPAIFPASDPSPAPTAPAETSAPPVAEPAPGPTVEVQGQGSPSPAAPKTESTIAPTR